MSNNKEKNLLLEVGKRLVCKHKGKGTCTSEGDGCKGCGANNPVDMLLDAFNLGKEEACISSG